MPGSVTPGIAFAVLRILLASTGCVRSAQTQFVGESLMSHTRNARGKAPAQYVTGQSTFLASYFFFGIGRGGKASGAGRAGVRVGIPAGGARIGSAAIPQAAAH